MSVTELEEPVIICVAGWRDDDRDSMFVLGWSEIDYGPIPIHFAHDAPICSRMQSEDGLLIGGLYAVDYERGRTDFLTCKSAPRTTTPSYDLGQQTAFDEECDRLAIFAQMAALTESIDGKPERIREHGGDSASYVFPSQCGADQRSYCTDRSRKRGRDCLEQ